MSVWFRDHKRLLRVSPSRVLKSHQVSSTMEEEFNPPMPIGNDPNLGNVGRNPPNIPPVKSMRDYLNPTRTTTPSCILLPVQAHAFSIKPGMLQLLPQFHGADSENPYLHVKDFEDVCGTMLDQNVREDIVCLKLFPFSLKDKAKNWLNTLRPRSISSWADMQKEFFNKFFPPHKTISLKKQIQNFFEKDNESFYQCWERFKDLLNAVPHHGFEPWQIVSFFHDGISPKHRQFIEVMCNGEFLSKDPEEALDYFDFLAENAQSWDTSNPAEKSRSSNNPTGGGKYFLRDQDDLHARIAQLSRKLEAIEMKKVNEVYTTPQVEDMCNICETQGHSTSTCPTILAFKEVLHDQATVNFLHQPRKSFNSPYSETYNPGWRNHPNFSWKNENTVTHQGSQGSPQQTTQGFHNQGQNSHFQGQGSQGFAQNPHHGYAPHGQQNVQPPYHKRSLEDTLQQFMQNQTNINTQNAQAIGDIRTQITKLTSSFSTFQQEKGKFPAQPQANPVGQHSVRSSNATEANVEQAKFITTLRSGKEIDKTIFPKVCQKDFSKDSPVELVDDPKSGDKTQAPKVDENVEKCPIPAPFPQRLRPPPKVSHNAEIFELFQQVKVNIPLLDVIRQVPSYAKFLKDLCTVKRKLNVQKKAFLTEQVSSIINTNTPPKYKDPGCPTISIMIGNSKIEQALLDLGASVNLLPYSVYQQLGLGELKPTQITLQLADRSVKIPRGVVENVLVQVDKFYFPVDFVVLDTQPVANLEAQIPVILGRPFLATSNAIVNCRNGIMKLSFGNMTLELNVFNIGKQMGDGDDVHEVNRIDTLVHNCLDVFALDDPLEYCLVNPKECEVHKAPD